jgi:hypothetical protein
MYFNTPMCAAPFAPPPDNTSPTFGLSLMAAQSWANAPLEINDKSATHMILKNLFIMSPLWFYG